MLGMLIRWLLSALALVLTSKVVPGITVDSITALLIAAIVLGLVNAIVKPILVFFTLPLTIVTLGLFYFVVTAFCLWLTSRLYECFMVQGFWATLFAAILVSEVERALSGK